MIEKIGDQENWLDAAGMISGAFNIPVEVQNSDGSSVAVFPEEIRRFSMPQHESGIQGTGIHLFGDLLAYLVLDHPSYQEKRVILGPVYMRHPIPSEKAGLISDMWAGFSGQEQGNNKKKDRLKQEMQEYADCFPIYPIAKLRQIIQFCYWAVYHEQIGDTAPFFNYGSATELKEIENHVLVVQTKESLIRRESVKPHNSYYHEMEEQEAVRTGNVERIKELMKRPVIGTPGTLSEDPLRNEKNLFISTITMLTRTAVEGGLTQEEAYNMSDAYIHQSEHSMSIRDIERLRYRAVLDFTGKVAEQRSLRFSPMVEKCIDYIYNHLHHEIRLGEVADEIPVSPSYLSRIFKQETGQTITAYVQSQRIEAAKNMLRFSEYSYLEIANYLNFKSQSYFIVVFRKLEGMTPMEYRKKFGGFETSAVRHEYR